ncbi:MAG: MBL fold metallo-hydrolase [Puniceicoccales bacterium]|nr:MBL fold metallo-hydrolase [Puniceicoccales bacterium]
MPRFGKLPEGIHLERIQQSPNYREGMFHNIHETQLYTSITNIFRTLVDFFMKHQDCKQVPSVKTDLMALAKTEDILVWFGHSSYFIQIDGKKILVDPIFSQIPSPLPFLPFPKAFPGSNIYTTNDLPDLDYLFITHDHWDHLDYETVKKLRQKIKKIICPLGVGAHFNRWGFDEKIITEMDWNEWIIMDGNVHVHCLPARHFSGRGFLKNKSLWASFFIKTPSNFKIFFSGDGGYGDHFAKIGNFFHGVDLAIMENGQYNENWRDIHMYPEETIRATEDLRAKAMLPVHCGKFSLSTHRWDEPMERIYELAQGKKFRLLTPQIGQKVELRHPNQTFPPWWK